ncbi:thymidylate kinase [Planctomicrobium sp. SH527]|uniref:thymidylate kinase n=1 Tax=Planctomicrobium sp. SH527 TaxID=3448123 RepID=UPI003F5B6B1B
MLQADRPAPLIAIEGIDGAGKGTQAALLQKRLIAAGYRSELLSFPRYQSTFFGARIGDFLNGKFGTLEQLPPFLVSLLFAGDRFESRGTLTEAQHRNDIVVLDRYVASNIGHQAAKAPASERTQLREWIEHIEYGIFGLPKPGLVVLLDIPVETSQQLIRKKQARSYTDQVTDLQESDTVYLSAVREVYLALAEKSPDWVVVPVTTNGELRTVEEISDEIWNRLQTAGLLPLV